MINSDKLPEFDVAQAVGLDPQDPNYQEAKWRLTMQLLAYIIGSLVEEEPQLEKKIEKYQNEFVEKVKNG